MDERPEYPRRIILTGGTSLVVGSIVFVWVYMWLASHQGYPDFKNLAAGEMLVRLYLGGPTVRGVWSVYAVLPFALIPGAVATYGALRHKLPGAMRIAMILGIVSALAGAAGLMRWPGIYYALGAALPSAGPEVSVALVAVYNAVDTYLGSYIGDFVSEAAFSVWSLLTGVTMMRDGRFPGWIGRLGVFSGLVFLAGAFRNAFDFLPTANVAHVGIALFPLWLVPLGVSLILLGTRKP